jgi:hypothetical protein
VRSQKLLRYCVKNTGYHTNQYGFVDNGGQFNSVCCEHERLGNIRPARKPAEHFAVEEDEGTKGGRSKLHNEEIYSWHS